MIATEAARQHATVARDVRRGTVPSRALFISLLALAVPATATLVWPNQWGDYEILVWMTALIPAFLLAYYRGWEGVATALAAGMAVMTFAQVIVLLQGRRTDHGEVLLPIVGTYLVIGLGVGLLAELFHRERERATEAALTDVLTGLPNRRMVEETLVREFAAARRGRGLVVVMFDLDKFKNYNDQNGHRAGDEALRSFGWALATSTRKMNICGRYGGEEFISVLSAADPEGAKVFVQRVQTALAENPPPAGPITVCAGIGAYREEMGSAGDLVEEADQALYRAKAAGASMVVVA